MTLKALLSSLKKGQAATLASEKLFSVLGAFVAVLFLMTEIGLVSANTSLTILVIASMGATTCLVFVVPHSPMAQPWPVFAGHLLAAVVGVSCAKWIALPNVAVALAVALTIAGMYLLRCIHAPSAGTAMIAVLGGPVVHELGWKFSMVVGVNAATLLILALVINNLIPGRRYPLRHTHHPHHQQFIQTTHGPYPTLTDEDFSWALSKMDGVIDVSREDLVDLYEFAVEHAQQRLAAPSTGARRP